MFLYSTFNPIRSTSYIKVPNFCSILISIFYFNILFRNLATVFSFKISRLFTRQYEHFTNYYISVQSSNHSKKFFNYVLEFVMDLFKDQIRKDIVAQLFLQFYFISSSLIKNSLLRSPISDMLYIAWIYSFIMFLSFESNRMMEMFICNSVNFNTDGSAESVYGPMNPIREVSGKRAWFVPILLDNNSANNSKISFGDGSMIPVEVLSTYRDILEENCVDIRWRKGDVLLLDNFFVQHARRPGKPPRAVLVAVCK